MKRLLTLILIPVIAAVLVLLVELYSSSKKNIEKSVDLPWKVEISPTNTTRVFGVDIGKTTLKEMMLSLHKIAEVSLFENSNEEYTIEAYFGKMRLGIFDAKIIAELDVSELKMKRILTQLDKSKKKATPSGRWEYELDEGLLQEVNDMRIWRLVYLPIAEYDDEIISKQFGKPQNKKRIDDQSTHWFYPEKGVIIIDNNQENDVFHYVSPDDFSRLKKMLTQELGQPKS